MRAPQAPVPSAEDPAPQALEVTRLGVTLANESNHPLSRAFASSILCIVFLLRRDLEACEALAREQIDYCNQQGFTFWLAAFQVNHGVALAHLFGGDDGLIEADNGITNWVNTGARIHGPTWSALLADAALASGQIALPEKALSTGLDTARENGEVFVLAELLRLTGRHFYDPASPGRGSDLSGRGRGDSPRSRRTRLHLLRAARDLARLLAEDGDQHGARNILQSVVADFPEHRGGSDFLEASELLESFQ